MAFTLQSITAELASIAARCRLGASLPGDASRRLTLLQMQHILLNAMLFGSTRDIRVTLIDPSK